jgi:hypothetical protein
MTCRDENTIVDDGCLETDHGCTPDLLTAPFFWGLNLIVSLAIVFGPSLLSAIGII